MTNEPWDTIDQVFSIVKNMLATLGFFSTLVILDYILEIWK